MTITVTDRIFYGLLANIVVIVLAGVAISFSSSIELGAFLMGVGAGIGIALSSAIVARVIKEMKREATSVPDSESH